MEKEEALKRRDCYRCTRCGKFSPLSESTCTNPACRAQLYLYGELITVEEKVPGDTDTGTSGGTSTGTGGGTSTGTSGSTSTGTGGGTVIPPVEPKKSGKLTQIILGILAAVMAFAMWYFYNESTQWEDDYYDARNDYRTVKSDYDDLKDTYDALQNDYNSMKNTYDEWQEFMENNGLAYMCSVKVTDVFNRDSDGNRIGDDLNADTLIRLAISITINEGVAKDQWSDPLVIRLLNASGNQVAEWDITYDDIYGGDKAELYWTMWTGTAANITSGTYVAEFSHKGFIVERHEIVVD